MPAGSNRKPSQPITRRQFLKAMGVAAGGLALAGCQRQLPTAIVPTAALPTGTAIPSSTATATATATTVSTATPTESLPTNTPTAEPSQTPTATPTQAVSPLAVAISQAASYDRTLVRRQLQAALDGLGGVRDIVPPGARVAIKVNLTGFTSLSSLTGLAAVESYVTHPEVVRALGELLFEAGASKIYIVEAVADERAYPEYGYEDIASDLGATLLDLNRPDPFAAFKYMPVGAGFNVYENYYLNRQLEEIDTFVSVAKLKCHWSTGVTLAMKNLIGLTPLEYYRWEKEDSHRSALHGRPNTYDYQTRLPDVIVDLNRARPIHLAVIDGILTVDGGEGPWQDVQPQATAVLIAGKNPVSTDAVATAVMGFDPTVEAPEAPFLRAKNHLAQASLAGLGPCRLEEIPVVGAKIEDVRGNFRPCE